MAELLLKGSGTNFINGRLTNLSAVGRGSVKDGTLEIQHELESDPPEGYSIYCLAATTGWATSPVFAREEDGGRNLMRLARGSYRLYRVLTFEDYGGYDLRAEIRTVGDQITAQGLTVGNLHLPTVKGPPKDFVEVMFPAGPRELQSFMTLKLPTVRGDVDVYISCVYSPIDDTSKDWTRSAPIQVRRSRLEEFEQKDNQLSLRYSTTIAAIDPPTVPVSRRHAA